MSSLGTPASKTGWRFLLRPIFLDPNLTVFQANVQFGIIGPWDARRRPRSANHIYRSAVLVALPPTFSRTLAASWLSCFLSWVTQSCYRESS